MRIAIPNGRPNWRFMRYVRPPGKEMNPPLYPLRPATRPLRIGIDIDTVPVPASGHLSAFLARDEIELHLLMPKNQEEPLAEWAQVQKAPARHTLDYTSVADAGRFAD